MRPRERRDGGGQDLFRARLDQIIDLNHELAKLARAIDWRFLEERFGAVYTDRPGRPPLPTRLMAGLAILKHTFNLSDEVVCARWVENPYYQYFCGEEFFRHALPLDRSSITRWRNRMGEERLEALLQESLAVATRTPNLDLHLIVDNYATHKTPAVKRWLKAHPRFHLHFTPTSASWLNMVERFFAEITRNRIRRGAFKSVSELKSAIMEYLENHNADPKPFVWTKSAGEILEKVARAKQVLESQH
jgi:Transposase domain (DUF772)/DDE superfamily endonuclease